MKAILTRALILAISLPLTSFGHHSSFGRYDSDSVMEIEGEVTDVLWRNPHGYVTIEVTDENGERVAWELETGAPSTLLRAGIERDTIKVGDYVRVAGRPPLTDEREIFASNILLPSGEELLLVGYAQLRWATETRSDYSFWYLTEGDPSRPELGIFRVWTTTLESMSPLNRTDLSIYPMTEAAQAALQEFDPATENPTRNCTPKGMPTTMDQPYPIEFVQDDNEIRLRSEEYDIVRTIHMDREVAPSGESASPLGYSVGRWEDTTLVVITTHLDWPWFNQHGIPQSKDSVLIERFSPTNDGSRLNYELTVTDPVNFTEPVTIENYWLYDPDAEVLPFDCQVRD